MKCIRHSLHLCSSEACKKLPRRCENFSRNTSVHTKLYPAQTRWLLLNLVVKRILEQWDYLKMVKRQLCSAEQVETCIQDPIINLIFQFLSWLLPILSDLNMYFQNNKVVITLVLEEMCKKIFFVVI